MAGWNDEPIVDVTRITGRTPEEVAEVVGDADSVRLEDVGGGEYPVHYYGDRLEVVFVDGTAEWITVFGQDSLPYSEDALPALGLAPHAPSSNPPALMLWQNVPEVLELRLFPGQGANAHFALIYASRPM